MDTLSNLENAVLKKLLDGSHPVLATLRLQAQKASLVSRKYSGVGFYCEFAVPPDVRAVEPPHFELGDVDARIRGMNNGAGFVLFVRGGRLQALEGYSYDEPWPENIEEFELSYDKEPRDFGAAMRG